MDLYEYLINNFKKNEPILISDIDIPNISAVNIRQQLKILTDKGKIKRFDKGIYFIPQETIFKSGSSLSPTKVIEKKYLRNNDLINGYLTGITFANNLGITTQVPMTIELVSNKATKDYRETSLAQTTVIIRKPKVTITDENYKILQLLDLIKDIDTYAEISDFELKNRIANYMDKMKITFTMMEPFLALYPDKIYKNMYETGVLKGVSA